MMIPQDAANQSPSLLEEYTRAVQDVESHRKALQSALQHLDRTRERFRNKHPQIYSDINAHDHD